MSTSQTIAAQLNTLLSGISIANGYSTDIGLKVMRGRRHLNESHIPCAVIIEGPEQVRDEMRSVPRPGERKKLVKLSQAYSLEGHAICNPDHPNDMAHSMINDIKRAVFADVTLGGLVRDIKYVGRTISAREDGVPVVSGAIEIEIEITEDLANP